MVQRYSKLLHAPNKLESKLLYFTFFKNNPANLVGFLGICRIESDENKRIHIINNKLDCRDMQPYSFIPCMPKGTWT